MMGFRNIAANDMEGDGVKGRDGVLSVGDETKRTAFQLFTWE